MRKTLLEMTQDILSSLDSDEVNSISDTIEALQVAKIIESTYNDLIVDVAFPEQSTAFQLNASGDPTKPTLMTCPTNVLNVEEVRYNCALSDTDSADYRLIEFIPFRSFMERQQGLSLTESNIVSMNISFNNETYKIQCENDRMPLVYTTLDDNTYLFDSFLNTLDTTLKKSKTMCLGNVYPEFVLSDTFIPKIGLTQFPLLFNRAKVRAFNELKQQQNNEAAGEARRQRIVVQKRKRKSEDQPEMMKNPRYGRK